MDKNDSIVARAWLWIDSLGTTTVSIACAIQCSVFPLLIGVLPLLGLGFLWVTASKRYLSDASYRGQQLQLGIPLPSTFLRFIFLPPGLDRRRTVWVDEPTRPIVYRTLLLAVIS